MLEEEPLRDIDAYVAEPDSATNIVVSEGDGVNAVVKAATLDKLIERITFEHHHGPYHCSRHASCDIHICFRY